MTGRMTCLSAITLTAGLCVATPLAQGTVLVELGSTMTYLDNQTDPGIGLGWTAEDFADPGMLFQPGTYGVGYNAGSLVQTTVPAGTSSVYTRAEFTISDVTSVQTLFLGAEYDDGYVAWINGALVYCSPQMPVCDPNWDTRAGSHESSNMTPPNYGPLQNISAPGIPVLHNGTNVLAVGVWNQLTSSSDMVIVPQLVMNLPGPEPRGPYLQMGADTSLTVHWRTTGLQDSRVRYGPDPNNLPVIADDAAPVMNHEIMLSGLSPVTEYFYSVGSTTQVIAGGDQDHRFRTSPVAGNRDPLRVWVLGDSGTANASSQAVRDAYESFVTASGKSTDLWLMLGDNAYSSGTDDQYQAAVFETYPMFLRTAVLWPTLGNHDAVSASSLAQMGPYYEIFNLPAAGEMGGMASGTEAYYSFDYANVHFICLNSSDVDRSTTGSMMSWLESDLTSTSQDWVIAYWHHPPYTKGSHDSDDPNDSAGSLVDMRQNALPILETWGVDLVLGGHSHSYERSFLLDGHYGLSGTLTGAMILDGGDGRVDGTGAYQKAGGGPAPHEGAVYVVAGSSGQISGGSLDHPAMFVSLNMLGSLVLDIEGDRLRGTFLDNLSMVRDYFTIVKNTGVAPQAEFSASTSAGAAPLNVDFIDQSTTNTASWDWDLDGDSITDSTDQSPSFVYPGPGTYTVRLIAANDTGSDMEVKVDYIRVSMDPPGPVTDLTLSMDGGLLTWSAASGAAGYDVVKGDLAGLVATGGDFTTSVLSCLENGGTDLQAMDPATPLFGGGFYYLVRSVGTCAQPGTYDDAGQTVPRDAAIAASTQACP